jgi:large subunit ribosomal protein L6
MEIKKIKIPSGLSVSIVFVGNDKFLIVKNLLTLKYLCISRFININKEADFLILKANLENNESVSQFNQFIARLDFLFKNSENIFKKRLILKGLGFRINLFEEKRKVEFKLGFSHLIQLDIPQNIKIKTKKNIMNIEGPDKVLLGNFVDKIISLKLPDCYKGKGF